MLFAFPLQRALPVQHLSIFSSMFYSPMFFREPRKKLYRVHRSHSLIFKMLNSKEDSWKAISCHRWREKSQMPQLRSKKVTFSV